MMGTKRSDWVLVLDILTGIIHRAHPDDKSKGNYVTACNLRMAVTSRGRYIELLGDSEGGKGTVEPTCDECLLSTNFDFIDFEKLMDDK